MAATAEGFADYLNKYVYEKKTHDRSPDVLT